MQKLKKRHIYIAACAPDGGIMHGIIDSNGKIEIRDTACCDRPMYLALKGQRLYTLLRKPDENSLYSGLTYFEVNEDGSLGKQGDVMSTKGEVACHLAVLDSGIYAVNYISGSVIKFPEKVVTHTGKGPNPKRQDAPHTHFVCETPDEKFICVNDLGADRIVVYDKQLNKYSETVMPAGCGPRHLAFSEKGEYAYCINELSSTVTVLGYCNGSFTVGKSYSTLPQNFSGESTAAAIRVHGEYLYASNRGADTVCVFKIVGDGLEKLTEFDCGGKSPRDFNITGDLIVCTNESSNNVTVFRKTASGFEKTDDVFAKSPLCVIFGGEAK